MDIEERFEDIIEDIKNFEIKNEEYDENFKNLFQKTNYENVKFFKFMNDSIKQNTEKLEKIEG